MLNNYIIFRKRFGNARLFLRATKRCNFAHKNKNKAMRSFILLVILYLGLVAASFAGTIKGSIIDAKDASNLTGVIVEGANFSNTSMDGATMNSDSFYGLIGIPTTTVAPATTTTQTPQPQPRVVDSPTQTTSKPVYIVRTEVRTVAKTLPNGPWTCERTYIYSDGNRTREDFKSESLCSD